MSTPYDEPYKVKQRELADACRLRLFADSRVIRRERLELRRRLPDGMLFVVRPVNR